MDLSNPNKVPFGEMDADTQKAMLCAWVDGGKVQYKSLPYAWVRVDNPTWAGGTPYRIKPEPKRVTTSHEMALAAWEHSSSTPVLSQEQSGDLWTQGTFTVDLEDGKPVRAVWEASQ